MMHKLKEGVTLLINVIQNVLLITVLFCVKTDVNEMFVDSHKAATEPQRHKSFIAVENLMSQPSLKQQQLITI